MCKVSVIVPIYNVEAYLPECIDSVLAQSFQDYELILVDDGSPDGCPGICDEYARRDSRISVIHKKNGGLSDARNAGLEAASGAYVCFLDSDDTVAPDLLEKTVVHMDRGMDMVVFPFREDFPDGHREQNRRVEPGLEVLQTQQDRLDRILKTVCTGIGGWEACTRIFVREKIEKYGLRFADNRRIFAEDLCFYLCYMAHTEKILTLSDCLYHYRQRESSIMGTQRGRNNASRYNELFKEVEAFYSGFEDCRVLKDRLYTVYTAAVFNPLCNRLWMEDTTPRAFREEFLAQVKDSAYMEQQIRRQLRSPRRISRWLPRSRELHLRSQMRYLLTGKDGLLRLEARLLRIFVRSA